VISVGWLLYSSYIAWVAFCRSRSHAVQANSQSIAQSLRSFIIAILFPINLVVITVTGGLLFTGATFTTPSAWFKGPHCGPHGALKSTSAPFPAPNYPP
jgi:formate/nitrite transporter FocA (FNT family)